ncbi:MAG: hypothetical protein AAFX78_10140 [Cyanobacteria bacterium J06638_20]
MSYTEITLEDGQIKALPNLIYSMFRRQYSHEEIRDMVQQVENRKAQQQAMEGVEQTISRFMGVAA